MKQLLYLMHVDWGWIKQRPHFLAEELSNFYDVNVYHEVQYGAQKQAKDNVSKKHLAINALFHIPLTRLPLINHINRFFVNNFILRKKIRNADMIWLCHPMFYTNFKRKGQPLIFDCMDDLLEFNYPPKIKRILSKQEKQLYKAADIVIASSEYLKQKMQKRYGQKHIEVINNAISLNIEKTTTLPQDIEQLVGEENHLKKIVYIGTIANWFNFNMLLKALDTVENIEFILFGPKEVAIPSHDRLKYGGVVEHKFVSSIMSKADALMMPFVVNELIRSVNPVKAYEYIYAYKPIFMPQYGESEKFGQFVYLYDTLDTFVGFLQMLAANQLPAKETMEKAQNYALSNNWQERAAKIVSVIEHYKE